MKAVLLHSILPSPVISLRFDAEQVVSLDSCDDLNCNPTCQTKLLPGTREDTDGAMVWTVVFVTLAVIAVVLTAGESLFVGCLHESLL